MLLQEGDDKSGRGVLGSWVARTTAKLYPEALAEAQELSTPYYQQDEKGPQDGDACVNGREELVLRCAQRRREKIGTLSDEGFAELCLAVRENPAAFVDSPEQASFATLVGALDAFHRAGADDDLLDDEEFRAARERRLQTLSAACDQALSQDGGCLDARLVQVLAADLDPDDRLDALLESRQRPTR